MNVTWLNSGKCHTVSRSWYYWIETFGVEDILVTMVPLVTISTLIFVAKNILDAYSFEVIQALKIILEEVK